MALKSVGQVLKYGALVYCTAVFVAEVTGIDMVADSMSAAAVVEAQSAFAYVADVPESAVVAVCSLH